MVARFAAALACAALTLGCGTGTAGPGGAAGTTSPEPSPASSAEEHTPSTPTPCPTPRPVIAYGDARDPSPISWTSAEPISDGRGLRIVWTSGVAPCAVLDRVDVDYRDDAVEVTVYEGSDPKTENPVCIQIAVQKHTLVKLREPLAGREVVDGAPRPTPS